MIIIFIFFFVTICLNAIIMCGWQGGVGTRSGFSFRFRGDFSNITSASVYGNSIDGNRTIPKRGKYYCKNNIRHVADNRCPRRNNQTGKPVGKLQIFYAAFYPSAPPGRRVCYSSFII